MMKKIDDYTLDLVIKHCRERSKEFPDYESYTDSEMDRLEEWINENLRGKEIPL
jgi:hypothetical protein